MKKWADYLVSKVKWSLDRNRIERFMIHEDKGTQIATPTERNRNWVIQQIRNGRTFCCIHRTENNRWIQGKKIRLENGYLKWNDKLPLIQTKRKVFISYYHKDNQYDKEKFRSLTSDLIVNKSVEDGDINSDVSDEYIKQLIQKGFLSDTTVLVVLIGRKTKCRKHIDWEISGALNYKVGDSYSGILGLILPSHPDYGKDTYNPNLYPPRLVDNIKTGYAVLRDYTTDRKEIQEYIEKAYKNRKKQADKRVNSRKQMSEDICK